jgi:hypothetical protein
MIFFKIKSNYRDFSFFTVGNLITTAVKTSWEGERIFGLETVAK